MFSNYFDLEIVTANSLNLPHPDYLITSDQEFNPYVMNLPLVASSLGLILTLGINNTCLTKKYYAGHETALVSLGGWDNLLSYPAVNFILQVSLASSKFGSSGTSDIIAGNGVPSLLLEFKSTPQSLLLNTLGSTLCLISIIAIIRPKHIN